MYTDYVKVEMQCMASAGPEGTPTTHWGATCTRLIVTEKCYHLEWDTSSFS